MPYERSSGKQCVVYGCGNNQKTLYLWGQLNCEKHKQKQSECPCLPPYRFHCVPKNEEKRREWLRIINRKDFKPSAKALVCSLHFIDGQPSKENPLPALNMGYTVRSTPARRPLIRKPLSPLKEGNSKVSRKLTVNEQNTQSDFDSEIYSAEPVDCLNTTYGCDVKQEVPDQCNSACCYKYPDLCENFRKPSCVDVGTQTIDFIELDHGYSYMKSTKSTGTQHSTPEFGMCKITTDSEARFFTGLNLTILLNLIGALIPFGKHLPYKLDIRDQILSVFIRLRLGSTFQDIARRFNISPALSTMIFKSWINIMANHLTDCITFLPRDTIRRNLPTSFKDSYPKTTCIVDCSEVFIQRSMAFRARTRTYSTYKGHNTAKFLVACSPNGFIMFVSHLYGGRASDNYITKSCGILNFLLPGDEIMADRGFTIGEDLCALRVKLNIPAFMKGRSQLSAEETIETRRIASQRIHIERAINRMRIYRILNTTVQISSLKTLDKVLRVIGGLCNMQDSLIKDEDELLDLCL